MITEEIRNSLKLADGELMQAETELTRPHEDVVTLSACQSVRASMKKMMHYYLMAHAVNNDDNAYTSPSTAENQNVSEKV